MENLLLTWGLLFTLGWHSLIAQQPILELKKSDDGMASWQQVPITDAMITAEGKLQLEEQNSSSVFYRLDIEVPAPSNMVLVSGGTLPASSAMGAVAVDTFSISRTEVTWSEWQTVRTWAAANGYRLPQEAEWEFAAHGGNQTNGYTYSGSNDLNMVGWYWDNSGGAACDIHGDDFYRKQAAEIRKRAKASAKA